MQGKTEAFSKARLESLAQDPLNLVYTYEYDKADTKLTPTEQIGLYRVVCTEFDHLCVLQPKATNEAMREQVMRLAPRLRLFQALYPKVFAMSTIRARTPVEDTRLDKTRKVVMLGLLEQRKGKDTEEDRKARTLEAAMRLCVRDATPEEMASTSATHADPSALPAALTRLDPSELGGSTVHQKAADKA